MKTDNVVNAVKKHDGSIELTVSAPLTGESEVKHYIGIRGGLSYPTPAMGAYFCILAQEYVKPPEWKNETVKPGNLVLLAEHYSEALSLRSFYGKLCDTANLILCRSFYTELPEDRMACGYTSDLNDFANEQKVKIYVADAFDADNFKLGITRIYGAIDEGELSIPDDSIIYGQLKAMTPSDLEGKPEDVFNAVNGLRHVLGSYFRRPPSLREPYQMPPPPNCWV